MLIPFGKPTVFQHPLFGGTDERRCRLDLREVLLGGLDSCARRGTECSDFTRLELRKKSTAELRKTAGTPASAAKATTVPFGSRGARRGYWVILAGGKR